MTSLDEHSGDLYQGLPGLGVFGLGLDEPLELDSCLLEQLTATDQVARPGRFVDLGPTLLIVEDDLDLRRQFRVGPKRINELERQVVEPAILQFLKKTQSGSRIFTDLGPGFDTARRNHHPDQHENPARHEGLLQLPRASGVRPTRDRARQGRWAAQPSLDLIHHSKVPRNGSSRQRARAKVHGNAL